MIGLALALFLLQRGSSSRPQREPEPALAPEPRDAEPVEPERRALVSPDAGGAAREAASSAARTAPAEVVAAPEPYCGDLVGAFVDESGRPIAGVDALVESPGFAATRSGADGRFALRVPLDDDPGASWSRRLVARKRGYEELDRGIEFGARRRLDLGSIALRAGGDVRGRVLHGKEPASGAFFSLVAMEAPEKAVAAGALLTSPPNGSSRALGADGTYHQHGVPPGSYQAFARLAGTYCVPGPVVTLAAGDELELPDIVLVDLPDELLVRGVVLDADGRPVDDARVWYVASGETLGQGSVKTGPDGRFLVVLAQGVDGVSLEPHAPLTRPELTGGREQTKPGDHAVVLRLSARPHIELRIVDTDARPVELFGWTLQAADSKAEGSLGTIAVPPARHAAGRVELPLLAEGALLLGVVAAGYADASTEVVRAPGDETPLVVTLTPLPFVAGLVTRASGEPVAHALVQLVPLDAVPDAAQPPPWNMRGVTYARTDSAGAFRVSALHPGPHRLGVSGVDVAPLALELAVPPAGGLADVRVVVRE